VNSLLREERKVKNNDTLSLKKGEGRPVCPVCVALPVRHADRQRDRQACDAQAGVRVS